MVKKSRLVLPGHSSKCILLNCGFFPRFGAHHPLSSFQPGQLEQSEGVIYSHIVVSFCRRGISTVKCLSSGRRAEVGDVWGWWWLAAVSPSYTFFYPHPQYAMSNSSFCFIYFHSSLSDGLSRSSCRVMDCQMLNCRVGLIEALRDS